MIVLNVTYRCRSFKRGEFLDSIRREGIDQASRTEDGNIKYDYYLSTEDPDEVLLIEKWRDAAAIEAHKQQPHFKRLGELKAGLVEDTLIEKYECD